MEKAAQARSLEKTISKSQVTATNRYGTFLNPPVGGRGGATNVNRLADKTVGKVSETNVREVGLIDGGMAGWQARLFAKALATKRGRPRPTAKIR